MISKENLYDKSLLFLIFTNIIIIIIALVENWDAFEILFIYWCQSIIIGFFNVIKILTYGAGDNNRSYFSEKIFSSIFFIFHYGMFHAGYLFFLYFLSDGRISISIFFNNFYFSSMILLLFINHMFSFVYNKYILKEKQKDIGTIFFQPYARIIPMHLTIILGGFFLLMDIPQITLVIFLILKTAVDVMMHIKVHKK